MAEPDYNSEIETLIRIEREGFMEDMQNFKKNNKLETQPCGEFIYPTHPQQDLKTYHFHREKGFTDEGHGGFTPQDMGLGIRVDGRSDFCIFDFSDKRIEAADKSTSRNPNYRLPCPKIDEQYIILMSDTYIDACNDVFRAYWIEEYRTSEDTAAAGGPATSKGRTAYLIPGSEFSYLNPNTREIVTAGTPYSGDTYPLTRDVFEFFGPLLEGDNDKISQKKNEALNGKNGNPPTHELAPDGYIFNRINAPRAN